MRQKMNSPSLLLFSSSKHIPRAKLKGRCFSWMMMPNEIHDEDLGCLAVGGGDCDGSRACRSSLGLSSTQELANITERTPMSTTQIDTDKQTHTHAHSDRTLATYLCHHSIRSSPFVISKFYVWIPILDQLFEASIVAFDGALGRATGTKGILADIWYILALN